MVVREDVLILGRHTEVVRDEGHCCLWFTLTFRETAHRQTRRLYLGGGEEKDRETGQNVNIWGIWVGRTLRKLFTLFCNLDVKMKK